MIPFRVWVLPRWFSEEELGVLDDLTASNSAVLGSLGGMPSFAGERRGSDVQRRHSLQLGAVRQRSGSISR